VLVDPLAVDLARRSARPFPAEADPLRNPSRRIVPHVDGQLQPREAERVECPFADDRDGMCRNPGAAALAGEPVRDLAD
jgi:hypothetical protein